MDDLRYDLAIAQGARDTAYRDRDNAYREAEAAKRETGRWRARAEQLQMTPEYKADAEAAYLRGESAGLRRRLTDFSDAAARELVAAEWGLPVDTKLVTSAGGDA
ncbi:hypothetical protein [Nonomuraea sp. SYSU D8015]|uniref:hypothetical protein n=1 Tax=Nonomuraea sp. SYSU D8015 TaxID=2593644 RepID=UPI0016617098|nr:hypothetical protein [Nonomuraea sp. SYSU D8015]